MTYQPQRVASPDGTPLVLITLEEYEQLLELAGDAAELRAARATAARIAAGEATVPAEIAHAMLDGRHPVAAWRAYKGWSQAELARRAGLTQAAIARIEGAGAMSGRPATRRKLADALGAPLWSLED